MIPINPDPTPPFVLASRIERRIDAQSADMQRLWGAIRRALNRPDYVRGAIYVQLARGSTRLLSRVTPHQLKTATAFTRAGDANWRPISELEKELEHV